MTNDDWLKTTPAMWEALRSTMSKHEFKKFKKTIFRKNEQEHDYMRHPSPRIRQGGRGKTGRNLIDDTKDTKFKIGELIIQIQKVKTQGADQIAFEINKMQSYQADFEKIKEKASNFHQIRPHGPLRHHFGEFFRITKMLLVLAFAISIKLYMKAVKKYNYMCKLNNAAVAKSDQEKIAIIRRTEQQLFERRSMNSQLSNHQVYMPIQQQHFDEPTQQYPQPMQPAQQMQPQQTYTLDQVKALLDLER